MSSFEIIDPSKPKPPSFVHLHLHTTYSLLDGAQRVGNLGNPKKEYGVLNQAKLLGMDAVAITDHGNMFGAVDFYKKARAADIKPIIGCEVYMAPGHRTDKEAKSMDGKRAFHFVLLAQNYLGYQNLCKIVTRGFFEGFYYNPRVDKELLREYSEGIIGLSGCLASEISQHTMRSRYDEARTVAQEFQEILDGRFYMELQMNGIDEQLKINPHLVDIAKSLNIPLVATNDVHYMTREDAEAQDVLMAIQMRKTVDDPTRLKHDVTEFYLKSPEQMYAEFADYPTACANTVDIAKMIDIELPLDKSFFPVIAAPDPTIDNKTFLANQSREGLDERWELIRDVKPPEVLEALRKKYDERLAYELKIIEQMGFSDYFLIVADFINWAKDRNIPVGPGRGCLTGDAPVMMADGHHKALQSIEVGDVVFSHTGQPRRVTDTMSYDINESLLCISTYYGDASGITMTQDHQVFAEKHILTKRYQQLPDRWKSKARKYQEPTGEFTEIPAASLEPGDWIYYPKLTTQVEIESGHPLHLAAYQTLNYCETRVEEHRLVETIPVNQSFAGSCRDIQREAGVSRGFVRKYLLEEIDTAHLTARQLAAKAKVDQYLQSIDLTPAQWRKSYQSTREYAIASTLTFDEEFMWVLGKWIADGWLNQTKRREIGFCFHANEATQRQRIEQWLLDNLISYQVYPHVSRRLVQIEANSETLRNWLLHVFPAYEYTSQTKALPAFVHRISEPLLAALLRGYISGDGFVSKGRIKMSTVSPVLAKQLKQALHRLNLPSSILQANRKDARPDFRNCRVSYVIGCPALPPLVDAEFPQTNYRYRQFSHGMMCQIKSIDTVEGVDKVYDITVEEDHSYMTYNGAVHNSAAGSLVAYATQITDVDPIEHDLLFERFLNPERVSMPDIDVDFCEARREEVIEYVRQRYAVEGGYAVSQIITFGTLQAKAAVRDVARAYGMGYSDADRISKLIPNVLGIKLEEAIQQEPRLAQLIKQDPAVAKVIDISQRLEGLNRHASIHAAGVVISDGRPLDNHMPLYKGANDEVVSQYDMSGVESIGLIKFDFLGLKNLTLIQHCIELIKANHGIDVDIARIPFDDEETFKLLCRGDTLGVFQLESSGMREVMMKLKPSVFADVVALVALYRPGPLQGGVVDSFIDRKHGREAIKYIFPNLEPILNQTYGVCIYQEQVMQIANVVANYSLGEADLLRRAMGKKKPEEMAKQRIRFLEGAQQNELDPNKAEELFDTLEQFAKYGFNKCLVGDTQVMDALTGEITTIQSLFEEPRDFVIHALGEDWKLQPRQVTDVISNGRKKVYKLTTLLGKEITATGNHPFRTLHEWALLENLKPGDRIAAPRWDEAASVEPDKDTVPAEVWLWIQEERSKLGVTWDELESRSGVCMREFSGGIKPYKKGFRSETIASLATFFGSERLQQIAASDVYWDTVVSIEPQGIQETFDLTVDVDHNFVANGLIVHNSHSAAYGLIAYQTGWLKANYRHEYMAALLTAVAGNSDKVLLYLNDCRNSAIDVLPPHVNESQKQFAVVNKKIRFGLAAVKGIGDSPIEGIIETRQSEEGIFKSFVDFCERIDFKGRKINKKVLEALIKCGAFDGLGLSRAAMFHNLEFVVSHGTHVQEEKASAQFSLFGGGGGASSDDGPGFEVPDMPEWGEKERLSLEKAVLGLYISGHPLDRYHADLDQFISCTISELIDKPTGSTASIVGIVTSRKDMTTKRGDRMAFLMVEDLTGEVEVNLFPKVFQQAAPYLEQDLPLLMKGDIEKGEKSVKFTAQEVHSLAEIRAQRAKEIHLELVSDTLTERQVEEMGRIFKEYQGHCIAYLHFNIPGHSRSVWKLPDDYKLEPAEALVESLERLFGKNPTHFK